MRTVAASIGDLPIFVRVAEARSFSAAARQLGLTASAASKAVARLEDRLEVRLLHRTTRRVSLTNEGAAFFARCQRALSDLEEAETELQDARARPTGTLRVSLPDALGRLIIVPRLPELVRRYPELSLEVELTDRVVDVIGEAFDAAVRIGPVADQRLIARAVARARLLVCASPTYLRRHGRPRSPRDLASHNVYQFTRSHVGGPSAWTFERGEAAERVEVRGNLVLSSAEALVDAARAGDGIIGIHDFIASPALEAGELVVLLPEWSAGPGPAISIVYPQHRHLSARVRAFVELAAAIIPRAIASTMPRAGAAAR